jgi:hypothetical protein
MHIGEAPTLFCVPQVSLTSCSILGLCPLPCLVHVTVTFPVQELPFCFYFFADVLKFESTCWAYQLGSF